jgi:septal ring factor EnvC (AmiA/AmiB activator)
MENSTIAVIKWAIGILIPVVTSLCGWWAGRRQRNNDFIGALQRSINELSAKNSEQMNEILKLREEIITVRTENMEQSRELNVLREENRQLNEQVAALREENRLLSEQVQQLHDQLSGVKTITKSK